MATSASTAVPTEDIVRRGVGHVPDGRGTFMELTVEENLRLGAYIRRDKGVTADMERVFGYFPKLRQRFRQQAGTLSGGEQQMLAIARALLLRPRLLLLDEPSFGLAPLIVQEIFEIMQRINREEGTSILVVEQNANLALSIADMAYLLETGRIVISGPADEISRDEFDPPFVSGVLMTGATLTRRAARATLSRDAGEGFFGRSAFRLSPALREIGGPIAKRWEGEGMTQRKETGTH